MLHETTQALVCAEVTFSGVAHTVGDSIPNDIGPMNLVVYGSRGECVQKYSGPAARQLQREGRITRIVGIDRLPPASDDVAFDDNLVNDNPVDTMHWLEAKGYCDRRTRYLISTPTCAHTAILTQLLSIGCQDIAAEKPLVSCSTDAHALLGKPVHPISHQLAKAEMYRFITECRTGRIPLDQIAHCDFFLLEEAGITPGRMVENVIFDMHWHGFEALVVPIAALVGPQGRFQMVLDKVVAATYKSEPLDFAPARDWTLATIDGRILCGHIGCYTPPRHEITYRIVAGKGSGRLDKRCVVKDRHGQVLRSIGLVDEPRWAAHYRLLRELVSKPVPDMLTTLDQAMGVVDLCERSVQHAIDAGTYPFGSLPSFVA